MLNAPQTYLLGGESMWANCDHRNTIVIPQSDVVLLASSEQRSGPGEHRVPQWVIEGWLAARSGAVFLQPAVDQCGPEWVLLAAPEVGLMHLGKDGWKPLSNASRGPGWPELFGPAEGGERPVGPTDPAALARDRCGRLWLLDRGTNRVLALAETDLSLLDIVAPPVGASLFHLGVADWGLLAADRVQRKLWRAEFDGEWEEVPLPPRFGDFEPIAVEGADSQAVAILRPVDGSPDSHLAIVTAHEQHVVRIPGLEDPLALLSLSAEDLLIGEVSGVPGRPMLLTRFKLQPTALTWAEELRVLGHDGRALLRDREGNGFATTARGLHGLLFSPRTYLTNGTVETFALDSEIYGCQWHRIFLDLCLPQGTSVKIWSRTEDSLPPEELWRQPHKPEGRESEEEEEGDQEDDPTPFDGLPLGSPHRDDTEGWLPVGELDCRGAFGDRPFLPFERDSEEGGKEQDIGAAPIETYEGLIKNPPGRYLWLRIELRSGSRSSPALSTIRATFPRPSLLSLLPAFWRRDETVALQMDHLLSLFEGEITATDSRIEALPALFDPRACPSEALPWLAGFLALTLDGALSDRARRDLVANAAKLYRQRGTRPGLELLCSIIAECHVRIVEAFRVRRRTAAWVGVGTDPFDEAPSAIVGPGLQLGGRGERPEFHHLEDWEQRLVLGHAASLIRRQEEAQHRSEEGLAPCSTEPPPPPLEDDPAIAFYGHTAHRFTVYLFRRAGSELERLVGEAVDSWKPAHTIHQLCWLDAGFRVGANTHIEFGTRIGEAGHPHPAVVEHSPIGTATTVHHRPASAGSGPLLGADGLGAGHGSHSNEE